MLMSSISDMVRSSKTPNKYKNDLLACIERGVCIDEIVTHEYFLFHGTAQEDEEEPWWDDNSDIFMVDFQMGGLIDKTVTSRGTGSRKTVLTTLPKFSRRGTPFVAKWT